MDIYPAHKRPAGGGHAERLQTVERHCRKTAEFARDALRDTKLGESAYLAGLVHDAGKYTSAFRDYITTGGGARGSVNHTFAGVRLLLERFHCGDGKINDVVCELLAFAAGSHHGLFDCAGEQRQSGFEHRREKPAIGYAEACENFFSRCCRADELDERFEAAARELAPVIARITELPCGEDEDEEIMFYAGLLARLLLSSVIEGDRRDTAEFMNDAQFPPRRDKAQLKELWAERLRYMEERLGELGSSSAIDAARADISRRCREFAERPGGVFRLNVPTGGGKTLSMLRYSLAHASKWGKSRIIYVAPLLSIIDQNAVEIRRYVGDESIVLEHHSNIVQTNDDGGGEKLDMRELLCETWDAPIIITSLVQLLNTLFSGKTTAVRRFHSLCDSVIVIDEVQSVPSNMLSLFSLAVNFLSEIMGASVVLCSATQPCLEALPHPMREPVLDMVPYDGALLSAFRRTETAYAGGMSLEGLAAFALDILSESDSLLIVCNKKDEARTLYRNLKNFGGRCFHLSAAMCMAHRQAVLEELRDSLAARDGVKTLCVSTQVIEAGIDISFERAVRLMAGMDSAVQTAGRCNRNAEAGAGALAPVFIVDCIGESLDRLPDIQAGKGATAALLSEFNSRPEQLQNRLDSEASINYYYRALYRRAAGGYHDYPIKGKPYSLLELLSTNPHFANSECEGCAEYALRQAFRLAGSLFEVFDSRTTDVIVPHKEGEEIITALSSERARHDTIYIKKQLEQAKAYSVGLYTYELEALLREGAVKTFECGALALIGHYGETGFSMHNDTLKLMEE